MTIQKMVLMPLELYEEYELVVNNVRQLLEQEVSYTEQRYSAVILELQKEIANLKSILKVVKSEEGLLNSLLH